MTTVSPLTRMIRPHFVRPASRDFALLPVIAAGVAAGVAFGGKPVIAQTPSPAVMPADVQKTMEHIVDLDLLAALVPLKWTAPQLDKLLTLMQAIAKEGEAKRKRDFDQVRSLAPEIDKMRSDMLKGKPLDTAVVGKIEKANADMEARFEAARQDVSGRLGDLLRDTLTTDQIAVVRAQFDKLMKGRVPIPADVRRDPKKTDDYLQTQALTWYAERFLFPERSVALLTMLKASAPASSAPPSPSTTPPPPAATP